MTDSAGNDDWRSAVEQAAAGDAQAQDELVRAFYPRVQAIVHRQLEFDFRRRHRWILPLFSTRDVVQEVFGAVIRSLDECDFPDQDAFVAYLGTMVRNRLLDAVRFHEAQRRDSRRSAPMPTDAGSDALGADPNARTPALAASIAEQAGLVHAVLAELKPRQRALLEARMLDGDSFPTIAQKLGYASAETARQSFHDAHARLLVKLRARGLGSADRDAR